MSVLCKWPESKNLKDISQIYSFDVFSNAVGMLDRVLKRDGVLVIANANFRFMDTLVSAGYDDVPIESKRLGYVKQFDIHNKALATISASCIFVKQ
jgi:hypothetical protein